MHIFSRLYTDKLAKNKAAIVMRRRALIAGLMATPIYAIFALANHSLHGASSMAASSMVAALLAACTILIVIKSSHDSLAGHCFTLSLAVQVFGEMTLSGGLQAPAAALSLLIVPAAIVTAGIHAVRPWAIVTVSALALITVLDLKALLPANELSAGALHLDRVFSLMSGIVIATALIMVFERQAIRAIDKLGRERAEFRHRALHDALTGMPNRSYFYEYAEESLNKAKVSMGSRILFYFDIDHFKQINDKYGHAAGDQLLVEFSSRLSTRVKPGDLAARLAGDEFAMISEAPADHALDHMVQRLRSTTQDPFIIDGHSLQIGISIGYALFPNDGDDLESLLRCADSQMYTNKSARRNQVKAGSKSNVIKLASVTNRPR